MTAAPPPEAAFYVAATIWAEARGDHAPGMRAIAHVIANRVAADSDSFGHGWEGVVKKPMQFSCWNNDCPELKSLTPGFLRSIPSGLGDALAWSTAKNIANSVMSGHDPDPTKGATFYHAMNCHPGWAENSAMIWTATIGHHLFYRLHALARHLDRK